MDVRAYSPDDLAQCLAVFDSNVPSFFDIRERAAFESFLDRIPGQYVILEHEGAIVGCGGWAPEADARLVRLQGMVKGKCTAWAGNSFCCTVFELGSKAAQSACISDIASDCRVLSEAGLQVQSVRTVMPVDRIEMTMKLVLCP